VPSNCATKRGNRIHQLPRRVGRAHERSARPTRMGTIHPRRTNPAAPAAMVRRSDGGYRAMAIPWTAARATKRRQVSWLAGHSLMHGLPRPRFNKRKAQWLPPPEGGSDVHRARRLQLQGQPRIRSSKSRSSPCSRIKPSRAPARSVDNGF